MYSVRTVLVRARLNLRTMGESLSKHLQTGVNQLHSDRGYCNGNDNLRSEDVEENGEALVVRLEPADAAAVDLNKNQNNNKKSLTGFDPNKIKVQVNAYIEDKQIAIE